MPNMHGPTLVRRVRRLRPDMQITVREAMPKKPSRRNDEKAEDFALSCRSPLWLELALAAKVKEVLSGAPPPARVKLSHFQLLLLGEHRAAIGD